MRRSLFAEQDDTGGLELTSALMAMFALLLVVALALMELEDPTPNVPPSHALATVNEGVVNPEEWVLLTDGTNIFTVAGKRVNNRSMNVASPRHTTVALVVAPHSDFTRVVALGEKFRKALGADAIRMGVMPQPWIPVFNKWIEGP